MNSIKIFNLKIYSELFEVLSVRSFTLQWENKKKEKKK